MCFSFYIHIEFWPKNFAFSFLAIFDPFLFRLAKARSQRSVVWITSLDEKSVQGLYLQPPLQFESCTQTSP